MTFWDNPQMVINHIRHSCVTSDDTGMSEMVIVQDEPDIFNAKQRKRIGGLHHIEGGGGDFQDYSQSFDIAVSPGMMGRTPKTNRNAHLRKNRPEHHCKTIHWNEQLDGMSDSVKEEMFVEKIISSEEEEEPKKNNSKSSQLSQMLEDALYHPSNPYLDYAKFDGEGLEDTCSTKTIDFFLPFLIANDGGDVMITACVVDTATVTEVKGLVLYKACLEGKEKKIRKDIKAYAVWIAEDDGTVDTDFPMLEEKEAISKYGFPTLAVDEKVKKTKPSQKSVSVKIHLQNNGYSIVEVDRLDVKMKTILDKVLKKRSLKNNDHYQLEKEGEEGVFVDLEALLETTGTFTFTLVNTNSHSRDSTKKEEKEHNQAIIDMMLGSKYKSYQVLLVRGLLASTEVSLGIHGQKIEIDPVAQNKSQKFWSKIKPVSIDVNNIAECEITDEKPAGRANFRIYYKKSDDFKHYEFETSRQQANEIVSKIYNILKSRSQPVRTEFLHTKEKKADKTKRR